jgi:2-polyprenyl-3-methyl-5-hydroxy-6-metoxy-1,4-benzoquinol methylase
VSVAETYGRRWSVGAAVRAEHYAGMSRPAWEAVLAAADVAAGTALLDVGCGSGELLALARARGAAVSGGLLAAGNLLPVVEHAGEAAVVAALAEAAAPFRRPDGSYLFRSTFRWVVTDRP